MPLWNMNNLFEKPAISSGFLVHSIVSDFRYSQNSLDKTLRMLFLNSGASSACCTIALVTSRQFSHARFFTSVLV